MSRVIRLSCLVALVACLPSGPAGAAEDYDNCTGTITSLPAAITTQGTWCLESDLAVVDFQDTVAIDVQANNVTIDCNGFRIDGITSGLSTTAILAANDENTSVRNCRIAGFDRGITVGGGGALVEDNRLDGIEVVGIDASSNGGIIRRNTITNTGDPGAMFVSGIEALGSVDVLDNIIDRVTGASVSGISGYGSPSQGVIARNHISGVAGSFDTTGIELWPDSRWLVAGNQISGGAAGDPVPSGSIGIMCYSSAGTLVRDNLFNNWNQAVSGCPSVSANVAQ